MTVQRTGKAAISPLEEIQDFHMYEGAHNDLILSQDYTTSFICNYDMAAYPFDVQKCSMVFVLKVDHKESNCRVIK